MLTKLLLLLTLSVTILSGCSNSPVNNIDAEPALAVLGGAIMGTQSNGLTAMATPKRASAIDSVLKALQPISEAFAAPTAPACPDITGGICNGNVLEVNLSNCQPSGPSRAGYWRSIISYTFPTAGDCVNAQSHGFNAATIAGLGGQKFTRDWGVGAPGDQFNIRVGTDGLVTYFYSAFPSGWQDDRLGGVEVTYTTATQRRIVVNGVHAIGVFHHSAAIPNPSSFDLTKLPTGQDPTNKSTAHRWDHTINTVKTGDTLFSIGPPVTLSGSSVTYGSFANNTTASFDGDIIVENNTVAVGATLRVQHNISRSIGVLTVTDPLVYGDPTCCWPTAGKVHVEYDRNLKSPTVQETVVFKATACGSIDYTSSVLTHDSRTLNHCF